MTQSSLQQEALVSIITPSYNSEQYIGQMIESIIAQTYSNWELLITDDCSTDNSCTVISNYITKDDRIKLFRLKENSGAGVARNESIKHAKGRYIAFCDSDDWWLPDKLQVQIDFMMKNQVQVCYSSYFTCNETNNITGIVVSYKKISYKHILKDNSIGFLTCIYDTSEIGKVFMPSIRRRQDWALIIKLLQKCSVAYGVINPLACYRIREGSLSNNKFRLFRYNVQVYKDILKYNTFRAWCTFIFIFLPNYILKKLRLRIINL